MNSRSVDAPVEANAQGKNNEATESEKSVVAERSAIAPLKEPKEAASSFEKGKKKATMAHAVDTTIE